MGQPTSARTFRRLAIYVLVASLAIGTMARPAAAETEAREQRSDAISSSTVTQSHHGFGIWSSAGHDLDASPSFFHSWLASIQLKLMSLKSVAQIVLAYAGTLGHTKPSNACK